MNDTETRRAAPLDPDELAALEEQRSFLLRSLRDLERERAAGDLDPVDYETLKDDYTTRAAAVLRAIEEGKAALPPRRRRPWRTALVAAGVVAAAALTGELLARASGERVQGQQVSGSIRQSSGGRLAEALTQFRSGKPLEAIKLLDATLATDPANPEALAYRGWILRLVGRQAQNPALVDDGLRWVEKAIAADPTYPDAHFFRGLILFQDRNDPAGAIPEFEAFLAHNPPADQVPMVEGQLQAAKDAVARAAGAAPPASGSGGSPASPPTTTAGG